MPPSGGNLLFVPSPERAKSPLLERRTPGAVRPSNLDIRSASGEERIFFPGNIHTSQTNIEGKCEESIEKIKVGETSCQNSKLEILPDQQNMDSSEITHTENC